MTEFSASYDRTTGIITIAVALLFCCQQQWRPALRAGGFSNPHYHSGWYRVAGGATVRIYRTTANRLVLLPPSGKDAPVLYEVAEPQRFVDEIRREWNGLPAR